MSTSSRHTVHLALTPWDLTDDYNRHGGVTLLSFLDNCSLPVVAHLLYDPSLSIGKQYEEQYNKRFYIEIAERYNCEIIFHPIVIPDDILELVRDDRHTPGTLLRLYLPELLPMVDKIIYLDCDIVVQTNIIDLWNIPIDNHYIAACLDPLSTNIDKKWTNYCIDKKIPRDTYFNAGMIIMNLARLREGHYPFSTQMFEYLRAHQHLKFLDQDMLNWFCKGDYFLLSEKYNIFSGRSDALDFIDDCIIHYNGSVLKPWKIYSGKIDDPYWHYLVRTPWGEDKLKLISYVRTATDIKYSLLFVDRYLYILDGGSFSKIKNLINITFQMWKPVFSSLLLIVKNGLGNQK